MLDAPRANLAQTSPAATIAARTNNPNSRILSRQQYGLPFRDLK